MIEIIGDIVEAPPGVPRPFERATPEEFAKGLIDRGIRARMMSASLLTGQRYIDMDFLPQEPARFAGLHPRYPELPTTPTSMEKLGDKAEQFFAKVAELPLDDMLDDVRKALAAVRGVLESPGFKQFFASANRSAKTLESVLEEAASTLKVADDTLVTLKGEVGQTGGQARQTLSKLRDTLDRAEGTLDALEGTLQGTDDTRLTREPVPGGADANDEGPAQPRGLHPDASRGRGARQGAGEGEEVMRARSPRSWSLAGLLGAIRLRLPEAHTGGAVFRPALARRGAGTARGAGGKPRRPLPRGLVGVLPVFLPGYLDRPQVVTWTGPGELRIDEFLRWAEPLDAGVARVLGESLGTLLPSHRVIRAPWSSAAPLRCRVRLELARFGPQESGEMVLTGPVDPASPTE